MASRSFYSALTGGVIGAVLAAAAPQSADSSHSDVLASALAATGATLLGFVLTAVTILAALSQTQLLSNMYRTGHARYLLEEFFAAVVFFMLVMAFAIAFIINPTLLDKRLLFLSECYFSAGVGTLIIGGVHFYSVMLALGPQGNSNTVK